VHPAVAALPLTEKGLVLGALLARMPPESFASRFAGPAGQRGRAALEALAGESRTTRASTLATLISLCRPPVPGAIDRIHPGWLRERLGPESSAVVRAVTEGLGVEVRRVAEEILRERGESETSTAGAPVSPAGADELRRAVFAGLVPLAGPGAPTGPVAGPLLAMSFGALEDALEARGAQLLGVSLRGAPAAVIARAAANLGERLAPAVIDAAAKPGVAAERDAARSLAERVAAEKPTALARQLGLRAVAVALRAEGVDAVAAVAQRLPPVLGRALLKLAGEAAV
jgi:hypothetical protein